MWAAKCDSTMTMADKATVCLVCRTACTAFYRAVELTLPTSGEQAISMSLQLYEFQCWPCRSAFLFLRQYTMSHWK